MLYFCLYATVISSEENKRKKYISANAYTYGARENQP